MNVKFLLGPAGSGKTHRCLDEISHELGASPEGDRLLFIAPRQSTFLLERQLLGMGVRGFTRLDIFSFQRLAHYVLQQLGHPAGRLLSEEGRVMVLRALLLQNMDHLKGFKSVARTAGFAAQLAMVLRELQRAGVTEAALREATPNLGQGSPARLAEKMEDIALMLKAYQTWLNDHKLEDPEALLVWAAAELRAANQTGRNKLRLSGLWLDGFAEMTKSEIDLLAALVPCSISATLAFCLQQEPTSSLVWRVPRSTFDVLKNLLDDAKIPSEVVKLPATSSFPRFKAGSALSELAACWPAGGVESPARNLEGINLVECVDPEAEALFAAKLVNEHVRAGGRYRDISVMVRQLANYGPVLSRVFRRHGIPFFTDHREPMGHHPLAELTRTVLNMAAHGWPHSDWIQALKSGLIIDNSHIVDRLENSALKKGLRDDLWLDLEKYSAGLNLTSDAKQELENPLKAFSQLRDQTGPKISGAKLADALRSFWDALGVTKTLEQWEAEAQEMDVPPLYRTMHHAAWEQMNAWCDNLALAFGDEELKTEDWLPIADAGLSGLTLGVIPPVLDQVFIGAIDRSRQPVVKLAIVLGMNAGVFPAPPPEPPLLNRAERVSVMGEAALGLSWDVSSLASREEFYAYIACTRAAERLCVCWSRRRLDGKALARSSFAERLLGFVGLKPDAQPDGCGKLRSFDGGLKLFEGNLHCEDASTAAELFECHHWDETLPDSHAGLRQTGVLVRDCRAVREQLMPAGGEEARRLLPKTLQKLFPEGEVRSSVSALEKYALCPFQHFASKVLRLRERDEFDATPATTGTFLHAILKQFHEITAYQRKHEWRDWPPADAEKEILKIGKDLMDLPEYAPQSQDALVAWETEQQIQGLAAAVRQMVEWFKTCKFNPKYSELRFRSPDDSSTQKDVGAWIIELSDRRRLKLEGSIDRLDVAQLEDGRVAVAVFDYKSSIKGPDKAKLQNGYELQLLGYLAFAQNSEEVAKMLGSEGKACVPAGAFYIPLSPGITSVNITDGDDQKRKKVMETLTHEGRADLMNLRTLFDTSYEEIGRSSVNSGQFKPGQFQPNDEFNQLLSQTQDFLKAHAKGILDGNIGVSPARFGSSEDGKGCQYCPYESLCRFDLVCGMFRRVAYHKQKAATTDGMPKKSPKKKAATHKPA